MAELEPDTFEDQRLMSADLEQVLNALEDRNKGIERPIVIETTVDIEKDCIKCRKQLEAEGGFLICLKCGMESVMHLVNDETRLTSDEVLRRRWTNNKYRHVSYGHSLLNQLMGNVTPTEIKEFSTLLQYKEAKILIPQIKKRLRELRIPCTRCEPKHIREILKEKDLGSYYKYTMYF